MGAQRLVRVATLGHVSAGQANGTRVRPGRHFKRRTPVVALAVALAVLAGLAAGLSSSPGRSTPQQRRQLPGAQAHGVVAARRAGSAREVTGHRRPNIVFVLTDDLSMDLLAFMPHVQAMERSGLTFSDYFVSDSLCCPSRSSIFSGNFPHDTHVFSNVGRQGGFHVFHSRGEEKHTFAVALMRAGYRTALMGKYLNGYMGGPGSDSTVPATYVPPGWSNWDVAGNGYPEFHYMLNQNRTLHHYGDQPADYLTAVLARKAVAFIDRAAASTRPFFLELATFAPHRPYVPAPSDLHDFPELTAPRPPSFDVLPTDAPVWLRSRPPLTSGQIATIDHDHRLRAEAVQAVDRMIGSVQRALGANHITNDTYLIFSSDNGLHMGQYRLTPGKLTAFDTDIHVPLVVVGPGVPADTKTTKMTENVDLASTFAALGDTTLSSDGHSLVGLLHGERPRSWRNAILVEHRGPLHRVGDPDYQGRGSGNPATYEAMRTHRFLYVEYKDGEREYYNLKQDPFELHNLAGTLGPARLAALHRELAGMRHCHNSTACWNAMHVTDARRPRRPARRPQ